MTETAHPPNLNGLVNLGNRDGVDIRPTLLRVMTDLYIQKPVHTEEEDRHFSELSLRLIDLVDAKTRATIADKIGGYPRAPAAVRQRLLQELIEVKPLEHDGTPPLRSGPAPAGELNELFFAADADERRLILLNLSYAPLTPAEAIAAQAKEPIDRMEAAALGHNTELFARELERSLSVSRAHARRVIDDGSGEPIVVAAVALGMSAPVLQRILLCLNPAISQSVQRVYELALLHEELEREAALRMIAIWQASHPAEKTSAPPRTAAHRPQYWQSAAERAVASVPERPKVRWEEFAQARKEESA